MRKPSKAAKSVDRRELPRSSLGRFDEASPQNNLDVYQHGLEVMRALDLLLPVFRGLKENEDLRRPVASLVVMFLESVRHEISKELYVEVKRHPGKGD